MGSINTSRAVVAGLLAGLVMNVIDFIVNVPLLGAYWEAQTRALNVPIMPATSAAGWITSDFVLGILLVYIYAAIRPRFGPGPGTAACAALLVWTIVHVGYASFVFLGFYSLKLVAASGAGGLVAALAGGQIGCRFYKEEPAAKAAMSGG
jgi:hypothetical protein